MFGIRTLKRKVEFLCTQLTLVEMKVFGLENPAPANLGDKVSVKFLTTHFGGEVGGIQYTGRVIRREIGTVGIRGRDYCYIYEILDQEGDTRSVNWQPKAGIEIKVINSFHESL